MIIFNFLKTTWPILFKCGMMHLWSKRNINCKLHDSCSAWGPWGRAKIAKFDHFFKNLLQRISTSAHLKEKLNYVDQEALYQILNCMSPRGGVLTPERGHIQVNGLIVLLYKMFKNLLYFCWHRIETDCTFWENIKPSAKIVNLMSPRVGFDTRVGPKWPISVNVYND